MNSNHLTIDYFQNYFCLGIVYYFCRIFEISETPALESSTEDFVENLLISTSSFILNSASGKHFKIAQLVIFTLVTTPGLLWVKNIVYFGKSQTAKATHILWLTPI